MRQWGIVRAAEERGAGAERAKWASLVADKDAALADKDAALADKDARIAELLARLGDE
jgi:hypothetical protein